MTSVVVLGDVQVEIVGRITAAFTDLDHNLLESSSLDLVPGGTAANFACAATGLFDDVALLGAVGGDVLGEYLEQTLRKAGVRAQLQRTETAETGLALAIRDRAECGGVRLLLVRSPSANTHLGEEFIARHRKVITDGDFFVTDGYSMLTKTRRTATLRAMNMAAAAGSTVVFDLVPHTLDRDIGLTELDEWVGDVRVVVGEAGTLGALLGIPRPAGEIGLAHAERILAAASGRYRRTAFMLRFGAGNVDQSLVARPGREPVHSYTGYCDATDLHGFGDRLTAKELALHFGRS